MSKSKASVHAIEVWGDYACITNPVTKVERWSYPCPTPSAARGIFDAIYCHVDEFRWQVMRIELLREPQYIALRRNEVKEKANVLAVDRWMSGAEDPEPIFADIDKEQAGSDTKGRTQRQTIALRDVLYRLYARIVPWPGFESRQRAFDEQFRRRVEKGKCFFQPSLGAREFVAFFAPVRNPVEKPVAYDQDLGLMLYDVFDLSRKNDRQARPFVTLFEAKIRAGVLEVPDFEDPAVRKPAPLERRA